MLLRESKKVNKQYRRYAIDALGKFLDTFEEVDYYVEVKSMLFTILENKEDEDGEDEEMEKPLQLVVMASAAKALGLAWTRNPQLQGMTAPDLCVGSVSCPIIFFYSMLTFSLTFFFF